MLQVWQRSWTVIRFEATRPGYWYFHCPLRRPTTGVLFRAILAPENAHPTLSFFVGHETQHLMLGLQVVFNVLPSKQPPVPDDVPTSGRCPTVDGVHVDYE